MLKQVRSSPRRRRVCAVGTLCMMAAAGILASTAAPVEAQSEQAQSVEAQSEQGQPEEEQADRYDPKRAGNPLRITAYVLHPVGVLIDYGLMRPCFWVVQREPFSTIFGYEREGNAQDVSK